MQLVLTRTKIRTFVSPIRYFPSDTRTMGNCDGQVQRSTKSRTWKEGEDTFRLTQSDLSRNFLSSQLSFSHNSQSVPSPMKPFNIFISCFPLSPSPHELFFADNLSELIKRYKWTKQMLIKFSPPMICNQQPISNSHTNHDVLSLLNLCCILSPPRSNATTRVHNNYLFVPSSTPTSLSSPMDLSIANLPVVSCSAPSTVERSFFLLLIVRVQWINKRPCLTIINNCKDKMSICLFIKLC